MITTRKVIRCVSVVGIILLLLAARVSAAEPVVYKKMCSWLEEKTSWVDNPKVLKEVDFLTTDGLSNVFDTLAEQLDGKSDVALAREGISAGRNFLNQETLKLRGQKSELVKSLNDLKQSAQNDYRAARTANPSLKAYDYFKRVDAQTNLSAKTRSLNVQIKDVQGNIAVNKAAQANLDMKEAGLAKQPEKFGGAKGFFQGVGNLLTNIDMAGAGGRIAGEFYEAFEGNSTFRSAFGRMAEEGARIKSVGIGAAGGAAVGALTGPGAIVASPVLAFAGGAKASELFAATVGNSSEKNRQYLSDIKARERYAADEQKLAAQRAALAAKREQEKIDKKLALQAKSAEYQESLKYLADLRSRVAAFNERSRLEDEARRKRDEQYELAQAAKERQQVAKAPVAKPAEAKPAEAKSADTAPDVVQTARVSAESALPMEPTFDLSGVAVVVIYAPSRKAQAERIAAFLNASKAKATLKESQGNAQSRMEHKGSIYSSAMFNSKAFLIARQLQSIERFSVKIIKQLKGPANQLMLWLVE